MTKTIVIGHVTKVTPPKKSIDFREVLTEGGCLQSTTYVASDFKHIELICRNYGADFDGDFDLMFAYNNPKKRSDGVLFIGYWNDGIV